MGHADAVADSLADTLAADVDALGATAVPDARTPGEDPPRPALRGGARYRPRGTLGEGGMGRVDRVWDEDLLRDLAQKRLRPELGADPRLVDQFLWEARVTAHLDHPNIVPIHDVAHDAGGELYFTMRYVAGTTLADRIDEWAVAGAEAASIGRRAALFVQLCHAVAFAHRRGVLHRDLKPGNVMLGEHGEVLVVDWGLALPLEGVASPELVAALPGNVALASAGTPLYMSPEQATGAALDARSDVYTLGVILYELTALARPYAGDSLPEVLEQVRAGQARPLEEAAPGVSPSLAAVVRRAMASDPVERYPDVTALLRDVERYLDGRATEAEEASVGRKLARFYMSHDPGLARLRVVDVDLLCLAAMAFGAALPVLFGGLGVGLGVGLLALSAALVVYPGYRWYKACPDVGGAEDEAGRRPRR